MNKINHYDLTLISPEFNSELTGIILKINRFKQREMIGTTPPLVFFQLKNLFHQLESVSSARIEGNNTTILDYMESEDDKESEKNESILEIDNINECLKFIDNEQNSILVNRMFISDMHKQVVKNLIREGSRNPGEYRKQNIIISGSKHTPPDFMKIADYMDELFSFINEKHDEQYDLIKVAIVHHRFTWIHPFDNGNGRVVRLLTYAMLAQQGFFVGVAKLVNPTAIFCLDRDKYYASLSEADTGTKGGILSWCEYMIGGLHIELDKISQFVDNKFLGQNIIVPALMYAHKQGLINKKELKVVGNIALTGTVSASDITNVITMVSGNKLKSAISRIIRNLIDRKLIQPTQEGGRKYVVNIENNRLIRVGLIKILFAKGFISLEQGKQIKEERSLK